MPDTFVLTLKCPDRIGIVAAVSSFLAEQGGWITEAHCHYVTDQLDAGPIIEQDVIRVNHADSAAEMVTLGRDVERSVLSRGLRYHLEDRVIVHDNKTVVFT